MSDIKLKPCPFCERNDKLEIESYEEVGEHWFNVICTKCLASGPIMDTEEEAADAWNMRAVPEPQRWIPVTDRLPEDVFGHQRKLISVLVTTKSGKVSEASRIKDGRYVRTDNGYEYIYDNNWSWNKRDVTHWMPLPKPPKEETV